MFNYRNIPFVYNPDCMQYNKDKMDEQRDKMVKQYYINKRYHNDSVS